MEWIFDGIGSELVGVLIGLIFGGAGGYQIGVHKKIKQSQKARDNANQSQTGVIINNNESH